MESIADVQSAHKEDTEERLYVEVEHLQKYCWECNQTASSIIQLSYHFTVFHGLNQSSGDSIQSTCQASQYFPMERMTIFEHEN